MNKQKYYRNLKRVQEDCLWPQQGIIYPEINFRYRAVARVICLIPPEDYEILKNKIDEFEWFIPDTNNLGCVWPFYSRNENKDGFAGYAKVIYLSPTLERRAFDIVKSVVAHELAHLVLGHKIVVEREVCNIQEREAFQVVLKWGLGKEAIKHRASQKQKGILVG